jgi:hypothetical protein
MELSGRTKEIVNQGQQFTQFTGPTTTSGREAPAGGRREPATTKSTRERLRDLILPTSLLGCWIWTGRFNSDGRPVIWIPGRGDVHAARVIWEESEGPIPPGHEIDHLCCNKSCPSKHHFDLVTEAENRQRALEPELQTARFLKRLAELVQRYRA